MAGQEDASYVHCDGVGCTADCLLSAHTRELAVVPPPAGKCRLREVK